MCVHEIILSMRVNGIITIATKFLNVGLFKNFPIGLVWLGLMAYQPL